MIYLASKSLLQVLKMAGSNILLKDKENSFGNSIVQIFDREGICEMSERNHQNKN